MRDTLRRYRAIHQALKPWYPGEPSGRLAQHWTTLAACIRGIGGSQSRPLPSIATTAPERAKPDSRVKRLSRGRDHDTILEEVYGLPYAARLLHPWAFETLGLVMEGSGVGRGGCALRRHVRYPGRARPLAWRVRQGPKGQVPADLPSALVALVLALSPEGTRVGFLGDGACDGSKRQETMHEAGWWSACRTSTGNTATWDDETCHGAELGAGLKPGRLIERQEVVLPREAYGPVLRLGCWAQGHAEPLSVVSNRSSAEEALDYEKKRFRIETFFSDQKSRGFNIHQSHLTDPQRLSRLFIASCLAYIWLVYLGSLGQKERWPSIMHRRKRGDVSLFQLGLRLLEHFLNEELPIPVQFHVII